jgi:hypothetical protein
MALDLGDLSAPWRNHHVAFLAYLRNFPTSLEIVGLFVEQRAVGATHLWSREPCADERLIQSEIKRFVRLLENVHGITGFVST